MKNIKEYYDALMIRLRRYYVSQELDPGTAEMLLNRARRDVQLAILPIYRERFGAILTLDGVPGNSAVEDTTRRRTLGGVTRTVYSMNLPADFIQDDCVLVTTQVGEIEARKLSQRELMNVLYHTYAKPSAYSPVYSVEKDTESDAYVINVSIGAGAVVPADVKLFYIRALKYLQLRNNAGAEDLELVLPYDCREMVIYQAMLVAMQKYSMPEAKEVVGFELEGIVDTVQKDFNNTIDRSKLLLPTRQSTFPNQPLPSRAALGE